MYSVFRFQKFNQILIFQLVYHFRKFLFSMSGILHFLFQEVIIKTFPVGFSYQFAIKFQVSGQYGYYLPGSNVLSQHFQYFKSFLKIRINIIKRNHNTFFIQQLQRFSDIDVESLFQIIKSLGFIHTLYRNEFFIIPSVIYIIFTYAINKRQCL